MQPNEFYLVNQKGVKTLCTLKRGQLRAQDTVHIVGGFWGGDTGWTLDDVKNLKGEKALTIQWREGDIVPAEPPTDYRCSVCGKPISAAEGDDNEGRCNDCMWEGWDFGGGVDDPRY